MNNFLLKNYYLKIILFSCLALIFDYLWLIKNNTPPGWDQGYHITNVYKMFNIFDLYGLNIKSLTTNLLKVTDSYRGPLTYFISALFLKITSNNYVNVYLSNHIFTLISSISIYELGRILKNKETGIWASFIFVFTPIIINQRNDYLIDLSLTSISTLFYLFLTIWFLDKKQYSIFAPISGLIFGLIFLTKPTGIVIFLIPLLVCFLKKFFIKKNYIYSLCEILSFLIIFYCIIIPWLSINWLTIFSSIINAWEWGNKYQDGLDLNTLEGWLFYLINLPSMMGYLNFIIFTSITIKNIYGSKNILIKNTSLSSKKNINIWFFLYVLNIYLILSLMSTKDTRFLLPMYPIICIFISLLINFQLNKITIRIDRLIVAISLIISFFYYQYSNLKSLEFSYKDHQKYWPHNEIIDSVKKNNPYVISTIGIIPDTQKINTFNLEAVGSKNDEFVAARQILNRKDYKENLKFFDWFLIKSGDQGIMTNKSKKDLNEYLLKSEFFSIFKEWSLFDESKLYLIKRNNLSSKISPYSCDAGNFDFRIKAINSGINIEYSSLGKFINKNFILMDLKDEDNNKEVNISLGNGLVHNSFIDNKCYVLEQNIPLEVNKRTNFKVNAILIKDSKKIKNFYLKNKFISLEKNNVSESNYSNLINKIDMVESMGQYLKLGKFDELFELVSMLNQSDPKQIYLKDAEEVFSYRYKEKENTDYLYSILVSKILQRDIINARKILNKIIITDPKNDNLYLIKSVLNIYLFKIKEAREAVNKANFYSNNQRNLETIKTIEKIVNLMELKINKIIN